MSILFWGQTILADESSRLIKQAYYQSYHYEQTKNYNTAVSAMLPVLEVYPKGYTVNLRLGWLYYLSNHYANSMRHYITAIKTAPDTIEARLGLILPQLAQERYSQAEQTAYQIITKDYANYYANLRLIIILRKQGKSDLALAIAKKMLAYYPSDKLFLEQLGLTYKEQGNQAKANLIYSELLILDPENPNANNYFFKSNKGNRTDLLGLAMPFAIKK